MTLYKIQSRRSAPLLAAASALILAACSGASANPTAAGTVTITDGGIFRGAVNGGECSGSSVHEDLKVGTTVTIYDASSKVLGSGAFDDAKLTSDGNECTFNFKIKLSGKSDNYQVTVGSSDQKVVVKDIEHVALSIGG